MTGRKSAKRKNSGTSARKRSKGKLKPRRKNRKKPVGGRPKRVFTAADKKRLLVMAAAGATDAEMAKSVKCDRYTLYRLYRDDPRFFVTIKEAKDFADDAVERSLYQRARGFEVVETHVETGAKGTSVKTITKYIIADVGAACMWLKNRRPKEWRDRQDLHIETDQTVASIFSQVIASNAKA